MFCESCGRKSSEGEKFCAACGTPLRLANNEQQIITPAPQVYNNPNMQTPIVNNQTVLGQASINNNNKKKSHTGLIVGIILGIFLLIASAVVGLIALGLSVINGYAEKEYIEFGSDSVPTIYNVVGEERKLISFEDSSTNGERTVSLEYYQDEITKSDLEKYASALIEEGFYLYNDTYSSFAYIKESKNSGMIIFVYYGTSDDGYPTMTYSKEYGDIDDYSSYITTNKTKEVGSKDYGYISLPEEWEVYEIEDDSNMLRYRNLSYTAFVILYAFEDEEYSASEYAASFVKEYEDDGVEASIKTTTINNGTKAYLVTSKDEEDWVTKEWLFEDSNGKIYYIDIEAYETDTKVFDMIDTYYLNTGVGM